MLVFDAITYRPDRSGSILEIRFDTARFIQNPTMVQYLYALCTQVRSKDYDHLRTIDLATQRLMGIIDGPQHAKDSEARTPSLAPALDRCL